MARRGDMATVWRMMETDPHVRSLPLAARALWHAIVQVISATGGAALTLGSVVPNTHEIAMLVAASESEVEANLQAILDRRLLVRRADGALVSPLLEAAVKRSEINRINGKAGGARRREQAEEKAQRKMQFFSVVDPGGGGESEPKPTPAEASREAKLSLSEEAKLKPKLPVDDVLFHETGRRAVEAAGFDSARWAGNYGIVRQWLADGATPALILDVIGRKTNPKVGHLGYFTKAIMEEVEKSRLPEEVPEHSLRWRAAIEEYQRNGYKGAPPHPDDFKVGGKYYEERAA